MSTHIFFMNHNNKDSHKFKRKAAIDGVSNRPTSRFNQGIGVGSFDASSQDRHNKPVHQAPNIVNDFKRSEGFHPTRQQQIASGSGVPTIQAPVIIDRNEAKKSRRGLLFWRRKSPNDFSSSKKKPLSKKKKILRIVAIIFIILAIILGVLFAKGYLTLRKLFPGGGGAAALQQNVDPSKLRGEGDGRVNILLLGRGGEGHEGADLTDTIIIASIDPLAKEAALVSIPRDLYVTVDQVGSMKINSVFYTGKAAYNAQNVQITTNETKKKAENAGFEMLENTIETTLGLPIHYHVMIDFKGFEEAINTVGGVNFNAPKAVRETMRINGQMYTLDVKPGQQTMDGFEALAYARSRYTSARGDFDRSERQRLIITALKDKILSAGTFSNPQKVSELMDNFGNHIQTNFSLQDLQRLYQLSQEISSNKISSIGLSDPPNNFVTTSNIGGLSVVIPTAGQGNFKDIQYFLRNALKDSYIKNENASIMVLNGTTKTGFATTKSEELKSFGYNITEVGNAPTKNYTKTVLVDLRGGQKKYTQSYLEKRFNVKAVTSVPDPKITPKTADFVIILGSDLAN